MEVMLFDRTAEAFQLADNVSLSTMDSVRRGRPRPNIHQLTDVLVRARTVEISRFGGRIDVATDGQRGQEQ